MELEDFEAALQAVLDRGKSDLAPDVLYHYTLWNGGFEGILTERKLRAFDHRDMEDEFELISADDLVMSVSKSLLQSTRGPAADVLKHIIRSYDRLRITQKATIYLSCFSITRDSRHHWEHYAGQGQGVCLGVRVLRDENLTRSPLPVSGMRVWYDLNQSHATLEADIRAVLRAYEVVRPELRESALSRACQTVLVLAAMVAIRVKRPRFEDEQEWRIVASHSRHEGPLPEGVLHTTASGRRYVEIPVRDEPRLVALEEVILGPRQVHPAAIERAKAILIRAGYGEDDLPPIRISNVGL